MANLLDSVSNTIISIFINSNEMIMETTLITEAEKDRQIEALMDQKSCLEAELDRMEDAKDWWRYEDQIESLRDQIEETDDAIWEMMNTETAEDLAD